MAISEVPATFCLYGSNISGDGQGLDAGAEGTIYGIHSTAVVAVGRYHEKQKHVPNLFKIKS